ncbi:hypothetical protein GMDG_07368 [Pseudogymnoascus destructans 20631-21]|uniref:Uncharacterized protein n=1 Tax=Pseudogymnoascus destructans (strain ATCC MYA-4855 / 20631-21) TaxID=658429 RepID=L8FWQ5_PSED2|nr:hypothetical protein GMDG_07368 [Pseudogymnoascus destructans 20631-21]
MVETQWSWSCQLRFCRHNIGESAQILLHNPVQCTSSNCHSSYYDYYYWYSIQTPDRSHCSHGRMSRQYRSGFPSSTRSTLIMASQCSGSMFQPFFIRRAG